MKTAVKHEKNPPQGEEEKTRESKARPTSTVLQPGTPAPDFSLQTTPDQTVSLRDFLGRPVVVVFYPADWSPVCGDQLALYNEILPEFKKHQAQILGISVDGIWCHLSYSKERKLRFPLLSDFEPKGDVARKYGVYRKSSGVAERALFVVDPEGTIRWSYVSPIGVNPGADGILSALEELTARKRARSPKEKTMSNLVLSVGNRDHIRGPKNAPVTLVEYGDFECPFCGEAYGGLTEIETR